MAAAFQEQLDNHKFNDLSFLERFGMIIDKEWTHRENKRLKNLLSKAKLKYNDACVEDINFKIPRGLHRDVIVSLCRNDWVTKKQNVIITGPTGCGKSYIACVLGNSLCRVGLSAFGIRVPELLDELKMSKKDGTYNRLLRKLLKFKMLILDDFGLASFDENDRQLFLEIVEGRYNITSTVLVSQLPPDKWHKIIGDPTLADAICDRIVHNAHQIKMEGDSMRKILSELTPLIGRSKK
jgi:DNA replication protein DnaC